MTVFVEIVAYREPELRATLEELFEEAAEPAAVTVGVALVPEPAFSEWFDGFRHRAQVKLRELTDQGDETLGTARRICQSLAKRETHWLRIDAHSALEPGWDRTLHDLLAASPSDRDVLTGVPPDAGASESRPRALVARGFASSGAPFFEPVELWADEPYLPTAFASSRFIFGPIQAMGWGPEDIGAEAYMTSARIWTKGFDLYVPRSCPIRHRARSTRAPSERIEFTYQHPRDTILEGLYRLDSQTGRSANDFVRFSGVDVENRIRAGSASAAPYVRTAAQTRETPQVAPDARLFRLDAEGILYLPQSGSLASLDAPSTYVWLLLEEGADRAEVVQALVAAAETDRESSERWLDNLLDIWAGLGALAQEAPAVRTLVARDDLAHQAALRSPAPETPLDLEPRTYGLAGHVIRVRAPESAVEWIDQAIGHLAEEPATASVDGTSLSVYEAERGWRVTEGHDVVASDLTLDQIAPVIKSQILSAALSSAEPLMAFHSAFLTKGPLALALPGSQGRGKSSLTAALMAHGWTYGSDEITPLDGGLQARGFPLALCIKEGGEAAVKSYLPETADRRVHRREDGAAVRYVAPPRPWLNGPARLTHIVFPNYAPGAETALQPISRVEALRALMDDAHTLPSSLTGEVAASIVDWVRGLSCYTLRHGNSEEAVAVLEGLGT